MKKVLIVLAILMVTGTLKAQEKRVITVPRPQVKELPKGFGVPIQRPQGFGKQQWQKPQQAKPPVQRNHTHGRIIIGQPMYYPYYRNYSWVRNNHNFHPHWCGCGMCCPPVIIQPQPVPVYPMPFGGFYFQFRF